MFFKNVIEIILQQDFKLYFQILNVIKEKCKDFRKFLDGQP